MPGQATSKFVKSVAIQARLARASRVAMDEVLGAKRGERVLVITNPEREARTISMALFDAALDLGAAPVLVFQPAKTILDFADDAVIHALRAEPEILISVSAQKLGKDRFAMKKPYRHGGKTLTHIFNYLKEAKISRSFWSPSVTIDMFERTVPVDYATLRKNAARLKKIFDQADKVHIKTSLGTDLLLGLKGRRAFCDDGDFSRPGTGGNLPAGEMYISPQLGAGEGTIAFDGCISSDRGVIIIREPIRVAVRRNLVTAVSGGAEAKLLEATFKRAEATTRRFAAEGKISKRDLPGYLENIRNLGELGIGLNEKARIAGNMLEDEKVLKTCHVAIGSNYDEDAKALTHLDGLIRNPTIEAIDAAGRSRLVVEGGVIL